MTRAIPTSLYTSTGIIEHALLHAERNIQRCELCDESGAIGTAELDLALESRLVNARGLIGTVYDLHDPAALIRTLSILDHLIDEALQLRALWHEANNELAPSLTRASPTQLPLHEACRSISNRPSWARESTDISGATHGA